MKTIADNVEQRECERCGHLVGTMSRKAWVALDRLCEECAQLLHGPGSDHQTIE